MLDDRPNIHRLIVARHNGAIFSQKQGPSDTISRKVMRFRTARCLVKSANFTQFTNERVDFTSREPFSR
jgi:hypothetical protein